MRLRVGIWVEEVVGVKGRRSGDSIRDKVCKVKSGLFILYFFILAGLGGKGRVGSLGVLGGDGTRVEKLKGMA